MGDIELRPVRPCVRASVRPSVTESCYHDNSLKNVPISSKFELDIGIGNILDEFEIGRVRRHLPPSVLHFM